MILSVCPNPSLDSYAWFDDFKPGKVNRIKKLEEFPGGKAVHVGLALRELGKEVLLLGNWAGHTGQIIKDRLERKELAVAGVELQGNNRKCYTFRFWANGDFSGTEILEPGPTLTSEGWSDFIGIFTEQLASQDLVCCSGSWPVGAPEDAYLQLIKLAQKEGQCRVILDCSGIQLLNALNAKFFGLHLNEEEAVALCGSAEIENLLEFVGDQVELIALSRGEKGMILAYQEQIISASVKVKKVHSTVGSGDCLTAGIAFATSNGWDPEIIAAYGVACGAANCLREELGMLKKEDVRNLLPKVKSKTLQNGH